MFRFRWPLTGASQAGLHALHSAHGALPWASLFSPVIALCERGFRVDAALSAALADTLRRLPDSPLYAPLRNTYAGKSAVGAIVTRPDLYGD